LKQKYKHTVKEFKQLIESSDSILLATHVNADGDAIGTSLALAMVLKKLGKKVNVVVPNDFPEFLRWLPGNDLISVYFKEEKKVRSLVKSAQLLVCLDFNDPDRLAKAEKDILAFNGKKVLIDHHPNPKQFTDLTISDTGLGSAAKLLFYVLREMNYDHLIDKDIAEALYVGIMTDTGNFNFASSYPEVWETVAELIKLGICKDEIYARVYDNFSVDRMKLMGYCLNEKMTIIPGSKAAYISLSLEEMKKFNHQPGDTEGFVNLPFSIRGVKLSALFLEKNDKIKVSLRSRGDFSVNDFSANHFRGGGHKNAAGGEWDKPMDEAIQRFVMLLEEYKNELS